MKYKIIRSDRKTLALQVTKEKEILVRAPKRCGEKAIESFVASHEAWIQRAIAETEKRNQNAEKYAVPEGEEAVYTALAKQILPEKTACWGERMGLKAAYVKITAARTRYGSCNGKNGICYSYRLMAYPEKAIDYVVVHELAHIKYKNHSRDFYNLIARYLPDYREREKILRHKGDG